MALLVLILLILGFVCFIAAAFGMAARINLVAAGLAAWILTAILEAWPK